LFERLHIKREDIIFANPYFQSKTLDTEKCQVDYLIQCRFNSIYVIEIKFSKNKIGAGVIKQVAQKIARLSFPKNYSYRPILIHVNGVTQDLEDENYFADTVNFSDFLGELE